MDLKTEQLVQVCKDALNNAHDVLESIGKDGAIEINHDKDIVTKADVAVSETLIDYFKRRGLPAIIYSEESGRVDISENPQIIIAFDDIDGTDNYYRGRGLLPYCTVVTIFDSPNPLYEDALVAGVLEHNSGILWHAVRGTGCFLNGERVTTSGRKVLDRRTLLIIDHYGGFKDISRFLDLYPNAWVKDFGAAAFHLAGVSSGIFDAYLHPFQKQHELGAGFLLINESGGFLSNLNGKPLDKVSYEFDSHIPIVAAATKELGENILSKIK